MRRGNKLAITLATLLALSGCGNAGTNTGQAGLTTEATTEITATDNVDSSGSDEADNSTSVDAETGSQAEGDYGYPESIKSDKEPYNWRFSFSDKVFKIPGMFDHEWNVASGSFHKCIAESGDLYYITVYDTTSWSEEVPSFKENIDHVDCTLDGVPDYLTYEMIDMIDQAPGIDPDKHDSPFTQTKTEFSFETDEKVEINGEEYIKREGTAHCNNYGMDVTVYFSCYFFVVNFSDDDKFDTTPGFVTVMTQDCSDNGKQICKDAAEYAVTNSFYESK